MTLTKTTIKNLFIFSAIIGLEIFFFYPYLFSDLLFAGPGDHRFNILIMEHWYRFVRGLDNITELTMFYPSPNALGYSDLNLFFAPFYIPLRLIGISSYMAAKIVFIGTHLFGSLLFFYFLNKKLNLNVLSSFLGLILFSYSARFYAIIDLGHTQFITCSLIPVILICVFNFFTQTNNAYRWLNAVGALATTIIIFYTSFYSAFFIMLFSLIFIVFFLAVNALFKVYPSKFSFSKLFFQNKSAILLCCLLIILSIIPLLWIYLPAATESGKHSHQVVHRFIELLHASDKNFLYGSIIKKMNLDRCTFDNGIPFGTFILFLLSGIGTFFLLIRNRRRLNYQIILSITLTLSILFSLIVLIEYKRYETLWDDLVIWIPGASAIRFTTRFVGFQFISIALLVAFMTDYIYQRVNHTKLKIVLMLILCTFIGVEQIRLNKPWWRIKGHINFIESVPQPPAHCQIVYADSTQKHSYHSRGLDMVEIANRFNLKSINGYSGRAPFAYRHFKLDKNDYYPTGIRQYIDYYQMQNVCAYDFDTKTWHIHPEYF